MGRPRKGDDIADRLLNLEAAVVKLLPALGKKPGGKAIVKQLEPKWTEACEAGRSPRRSTSTGSTEPARSERCAAQQAARTMGRHAVYWLTLAARAELLDRTHHLATLIDEADQLVAILTASANTARQRAER